MQPHQTQSPPRVRIASRNRPTAHEEGHPDQRAPRAGQTTEAAAHETSAQQARRGPESAAVAAAAVMGPPGGLMLLPPRIEPSHWSAALPARIRRPKPCTSDAAEVARCRSTITWVRWWVGWLARTSCRVVGHTGDWTYPDERCVRVRMCERCGEVTKRQEHTWTAFEYVANKRCEQERRCDRCGAVESRVVHQWGPWLYVGTEQHFASATPAAAVARRNTPATYHASVDRSGPLRAAADRAARHSLGASNVRGHALLLSPGRDGTANRLLTAGFHAFEQPRSRPTCRRPRYRYRVVPVLEAHACSRASARLRQSAALRQTEERLLSWEGR